MPMRTLVMSAADDLCTLVSYAFNVVYACLHTLLLVMSADYALCLRGIRHAYACNASGIRHKAQAYACNA